MEYPAQNEMNDQDRANPSSYEIVSWLITGALLILAFALHLMPALLRVTRVRTCPSFGSIAPNYEVGGQSRQGRGGHLPVHYDRGVVGSADGGDNLLPPERVGEYSGGNEKNGGDS